MATRGVGRAEPGSRGWSVARLLGAGAALIAVTYGLARFALGLFVPELRAAFGLTATGVGWVLAGSFSGYVAALAAAGFLVRRAGARAVAVAAGGLAAAGMAGIAAAPNAVVLGIAATVGGASTGLASPALAAAVEQHLPPARRAGAQTVINAGTSLGLVAAVPAALVAAALWRAAWAAFAATAVVVTVAAAFALRDAPHRETPLGRPVRLSLPLSLAAVLLGIASVAFWGFSRELVETASALPPAVGRTLWLAAGLGGLAGAGAGRLAGRRGLKAALGWGWLGLAGALAGFAAWAMAAPPILAAAAPLALAALFGAGYMALTGLLIVWAVRERPDSPAPAVASAFLVLAVGQIVGSPATGTIADAFGLPVAFAVAAAVAAAGALALPGAQDGAAGQQPAARTPAPCEAVPTAEGWEAP